MESDFVIYIQYIYILIKILVSCYHDRSGGPVDPQKWFFYLSWNLSFQVMFFGSDVDLIEFWTTETILSSQEHIVFSFDLCTQESILLGV
jgi:hypothetical protein